MKQSYRINKGIILAIFFALKPIYLWESGGLQLCDFFMVFATIYLLFWYKGVYHFPTKAIKTIWFFASLCVYQMIVNLIWSIKLDIVLIKPSLYYIYNFIAFFNCLVICNEIGLKDAKKSIVYGCLVSLIISSTGLLLATMRARGLGFFNNPNQLGYFALIMYTITLYCYTETGKKINYLMRLFSIWLIIASASKAAFIAIIIMTLFYNIYVNKRLTIRRLLFQIVTILLFFSCLFIFFFSTSDTILSNRSIVFMRNRIVNMSKENDSSLGSGRGYNRIFELEEHFLWGMGEGNYTRFDSLSGLEVHSSYVNLFVSYGLIGLLGYLILFVRCIANKKLIIRNFILLNGILLYGITHNGLRNTLLWILLAVFLYENAIIGGSKLYSLSNDYSIKGKSFEI